MIGFLKGSVAAVTAEGCLLEVGGVGYKLSCPASTLREVPGLGETTTLWTYLHVREDTLALFGFASEAERALFEALLGVSGVGPKVALHVCSAFTPESFRRALVTDDVDSIASVPGIGKKTAARMVLDLKEKLELPDLELVGAQPDTLARARSALQNLGYSPNEVRRALSEVSSGDDVRVEDVVKSALKVLA